MNKGGNKGDGGKKGGKGGKGGGKGKGNPAVTVAPKSWDEMGHREFLRRLAEKDENKFLFRVCKCGWVNAPNRAPPHHPMRICCAFVGNPSNRTCNKRIPDDAKPVDIDGKPKPPIPGDVPTAGKRTTRRKLQRKNKKAKVDEDGEMGDDDDQDEDADDPVEAEQRKAAKKRRAYRKLCKELGLEPDPTQLEAEAESAEMEITEGSDLKERRTEHNNRRQHIDEVRAALKALKAMTNCPDHLAAEIVRMEGEIEAHEQEGRELATPKVRKNNLRLAHTKATAAFNAKKSECEKCEKDIAKHREAISVARAELEKLEPISKELSNELVQAERVKEDALREWSAAKLGAAKSPAIVADAGGSSHTSLAKQGLANIRTLFLAAGPELMSKHIGHTGEMVTDSFESAVNNLCVDLEYKMAKGADFKVQVDDQIIPWQQQFFNQAATEIADGIPDDFELPEVAAETDPEKKRKLLASKKVETAATVKKLKGLVKDVADKKSRRRV